MSNEVDVSSVQNLFQMLQNKDIVIPIIQRDYAQGRDNDNAKEIRNNFIQDIFKSLDEGRKLKLSFVYGTEDSGQYIPYDGQQRLTLVYLIGFYLARYAKIETKGLKQFSYKTRDYSTDFCVYLTSKESFFYSSDITVLSIDEKKCALKEAIENDVSFFTAWKNDPTVFSMVNVLQSIHTIFGTMFKDHDKIKKAENFLELIKKGYIFFDWCTLDVGDAIYVKMNGRGKTLSAFDNFKNTLYSILDGIVSQEVSKDIDDKKNEKLQILSNFKLKMEDTWTQLFWDFHERVGVGPEGENIAPAMMNFFYFLFEYRYVAKKETFFFGSAETVRWLDEKKIISFLALFKEAFYGEQTGKKVLDIDDLVWFSKLMDILSNRLKKDSPHKIENKHTAKEYLSSEESIFELLCKEEAARDHRSRATAAWIYDYLVNASVFDENGSLVKNDFNHLSDWMQIFYNILETTRFFNDHMNDMVCDKHLYAGISKFVKNVFDINKEGNIIDAARELQQTQIDELKKYLVPHVDNQLQEEYEKLKLKADPIWKDAISEAETILYFNAQIFFEPVKFFL